MKYEKYSLRSADLCGTAEIITEQCTNHIIPGIFLSILLVWALSNNSNAVPLISWAVALNVFKVISVVHPVKSSQTIFC